jgi:CheY-like chemotaxis protein
MLLEKLPRTVQKVLVIENERQTLNLLLEMLEAEGFMAIGAENGLVGIEQAQRQQPDLVICDIRMPRLDGYSVLAQLRQNHSTAKIPVIFLTAEAVEIENSHTRGLKADRYLQKPCTTEDILRAIVQVTNPNDSTYGGDNDESFSD